VTTLLSILLIGFILLYLDALTSRSEVPGGNLTRRDFRFLGWKPTHQHYKGGFYEEATRAIATDGIAPGEAVVIYVHERGDVYARPARLFDEEARFTPLKETDR
jgi:hypothetical protein